jgi:flagellar biosynthesis/type III secretory pathway chaperone
VTPEAFTQTLDRLEQVLARESADMARGAFAEAAAHLEEKQALLAELEAGQAAAAEYAKADPALARRLFALRDTLRGNGRKIERVGQAMGDLARDITAARDRHGLGGMYGKNGAQAGLGVTNTQLLDERA